MKMLKSTVAVIVAVFAAIGVLLMQLSHADTFNTKIEAEAGQIASAATASIGDDPAASGGKFVRFKANATTGAAAQSELAALIQDVTTATGYQYATRDSAGDTMDTLKIIDNPDGGYLAVYHAHSMVKLATSTDLFKWTFKANLDPHATQPTLAKLSDGGFLMVDEAGDGDGGHVRVVHYPDLNALLTAKADKAFKAPQTLSSCNEGTPNIYAVKLNPDINNSVITLGMHYHNNCDTDREAYATFTNFKTWKANIQREQNNALIAAASAAGQSVGGNIGDRDYIEYKGEQINIHEVQYRKNDFGTWRPYLFNFKTNKAQLLTIKTHKGSKSFANPTFSYIKAPGTGQPAIVMTMFVPYENAAAGESGPLIYYKLLPQ